MVYPRLWGYSKHSDYSKHLQVQRIYVQYFVELLLYLGCDTSFKLGSVQSVISVIFDWYDLFELVFNDERITNDIQIGWLNFSFLLELNIIWLLLELKDECFPWYIASSDIYLIYIYIKSNNKIRPFWNFDRCCFEVSLREQLWGPKLSPHCSAVRTQLTVTRSSCHTDVRNCRFINLESSGSGYYGGFIRLAYM